MKSRYEVVKQGVKYYVVKKVFNGNVKRAISNSKCYSSANKVKVALNNY